MAEQQQQQKIGGIHHSNSDLAANQQPLHILQQSKVEIEQQMQQIMLQQQQLTSQFQFLQQQHSLILWSMLQQQSTIDQQNQLLQSPKAPLNSSSKTGAATGGDWQEEIYQKIKSMHEMYYPELNEMYQRMAAKLQMHDTHPQQPRNEQHEKLRFLKLMLERLIMFLRTNKNDIQPNHKEKIVGVEKQIVNILNSNRPRYPVSSLQQPQPQMSQTNSNEGQMNSRMQATNVSSQDGLTSLQSQPNPTILQPQEIKQEQQML